MLPDLALMNCQDLAVPTAVMQHVVHVESAFNTYAIGVVGGHLVRQPQTLPEAVATARMLEDRGYNFSLGLAQVNRYNLGRYGLTSYEKAFQICPNLLAGSKILAQCMARSGNDWGKSFSCYYSGNFTTGFQQGYVQKIFASMRGAVAATDGLAIHVIDNASRHRPSDIGHVDTAPLSVLARRIMPSDALPTTLQPVSATPGAISTQLHWIAVPGESTPQIDLGTPVRVTTMGIVPTSPPGTTGAAPHDTPVDEAFVF